MKMTITIPYRPTNGGMDSIDKKIVQRDDGFWEYEKNGELVTWGRNDKDTIERCVQSINKNSRYKHDIVVLIDHDMEYKDNWLKKYGDNIIIFKAPLINSVTPQKREPHALKEFYLQQPDDVLMCHCLIADAIVSKDWDVTIKNAIDKYGDNYVYAPMFVEPRTLTGRSNLPYTGYNNDSLTKEILNMGEQNTSNIWGVWRRDICCHSLTIKPPIDRSYMTEQDMDDFIKIANQYEREYIEEPCGARGYGYWAPLIVRNKYFKEIFNRMPSDFSGWDLWLDNNLPVHAKIVLTRSYVFHFHMPCKLDNNEVMHE